MRGARSASTLAAAEAEAPPPKVSFTRETRSCTISTAMPIGVQTPDFKDVHNTAGLQPAPPVGPVSGGRARRGSVLTMRMATQGTRLQQRLVMKETYGVQHRSRGKWQQDGEEKEEAGQVEERESRQASKDGFRIDLPSNVRSRALSQGPYYWRVLASAKAVMSSGLQPKESAPACHREPLAT